AALSFQVLPIRLECRAKTGKILWDLMRREPPGRLPRPRHGLLSIWMERRPMDSTNDVADSGGMGPEKVGNMPRREAILLLLLASVQFTSIVDFMVVMPLGPQLIRTMKLAPAQFGWIVSSYTIAAGLAGLLASSIMDRFGRKAAFLGLYAGFLVGTFLCGLA